jgi:GT2 family glycosyltransferase
VRGPLFLGPNAIYASKICQRDDRVWFDNCFVAISDYTWGNVREFDEAFKVCAFEDADYSFRAKEQGIPVISFHFPFDHLEGQTRWKIDKYSETRQANFDYLVGKHRLDWT